MGRARSRGRTERTDASWHNLRSPQARPRGRRNAADGRNPSLRCHITVCYTQVITPASADVFPMVGGRCTDRTHRCKAKQGRRGRTALIFWILSHRSTVFGRRPEGKQIYLVTMTVRCFVIIPDGLQTINQIFVGGLRTPGLKPSIYIQRSRGFKKPASPD